MTDHIAGKSIIVTGAGGGFGRLVCQKAAVRGAKITAADIDGDAAEALAGELGEPAIAVCADVTDIAQMRALAEAAIDAHGAIDVMINNAGVMPLGFFADHEAGLDAWHRCLDINIKGVLNGMVAVYDRMMAQGRGHIVNISSIYGNFPVVGAGVYGATKSAVNFLSESMRVEGRGKIKVTVVKPTGVPGTGLSGGIVNPDAVVGIVGQNALEFGATMEQYAAGALPPEKTDPESIDYPVLDPGHIADAVLHAIDQPWGVAIGDITVRASGDHYIL